MIVAALFGFATGFMATLFIGISQSVDSDCDGVCFSALPTVALAAYGVGVVCAVASAFGAYRFIARRIARPGEAR